MASTDAHWRDEVTADSHPRYEEDRPLAVCPAAFVVLGVVGVAMLVAPVGLVVWWWVGTGG